jgi:hypothetical protein
MIKNPYANACDPYNNPLKQIAKPIEPTARVILWAVNFFSPTL